MTEKYTATLTVFGIRPLIEAVESGKVPDKVFIQKGLRGENASELMALLRDRDIAYKVVPEEKLGPPYAGKPPGGVRISLACGICLGRGCGR